MEKQEGIFKQYGVIGVVLISTMLLAMLFQTSVGILGLVYNEFSIFYLVITIISFMTLEMCCNLLLNKESQVFKVFSKIMQIKLKENK